MSLSLQVALHVMATKQQVEDKVYEHFSHTQLAIGGGVVAAFFVLGIIKKILLLMLLCVIAVGVTIAYQNGAFDGWLIKAKKTKLRYA